MERKIGALCEDREREISRLREIFLGDQDLVSSLGFVFLL